MVHRLAGLYADEYAPDRAFGVLLLATARQAPAALRRWRAAARASRRSDDAIGLVERELHPCAVGVGRRVGGRRRRGRRGAAGDQVHRRRLPSDELLAAGYDVAFTGSGGTTGSPSPRASASTRWSTGFEGQPAFDGEVEARAISAVCGGVRVWSLYVPNGRAPGDPHFVYKLDWLTALRDRAALWLAHDPAAQIALAGDWNRTDRCRRLGHRGIRGKTHVTDAERAAFDAFAQAGHTDAARPHLDTAKTTRSGTTNSCGSPATRACGSTSCCAHRR